MYVIYAQDSAGVAYAGLSTVNITVCALPGSRFCDCAHSSTPYIQTIRYVTTHLVIRIYCWYSTGSIIVDKCTRTDVHMYRYMYLAHPEISPFGRRRTTLVPRLSSHSSQCIQPHHTPTCPRQPKEQSIACTSARQHDQRW